MFFSSVFRLPRSWNRRTLGYIGAMLAKQPQSHPPLLSHHLGLGAKRTFVLHKTSCSLLGPLQLGQILRRAHDRAADGGDSELFNRADRDAAFLPTDINEKNVKSLRWCCKQRLQSSRTCCRKRNDPHKTPRQKWRRQKRVSTNFYELKSFRSLKKGFLQVTQFINRKIRRKLLMKRLRNISVELNKLFL